MSSRLNLHNPPPTTVNLDRSKRVLSAPTDPYPTMAYAMIDGVIIAMLLTLHVAWYKIREPKQGS